MSESGVWFELSPEEKRALAPPADIPVSEWVEQNVKLPEGHGNVMPGPINLGITPHLIEPLDMLGNPHVTSISMMWPSQVGKTTFAILALCYWNAQNPGDCMWVMPNKEDGADFNTERFMPVMRESFPEMISGRKHDARALMFKSLHGMTTRFRGAQSPAGLASWPCRYVVFDEVEKFKDFIGDEADPISLGRSRMKTFVNSLELLMSTPALTDGQFYREFLKTDQREYNLPCVECGAYGEMSMDRDAVGMHRVKWPADALAEEISGKSLAWLECHECGHKHSEADRVTMIERGGLWVPKGASIIGGEVVGGAENPQRLGYHLSQLSTRWVSMSEIAATFVAAQGNRAKLQDFENAWMGRPFANVVKTVRKSDLERLKLQLEPGTVPDEAHYLVGTADVQEHVLYYVVRAYGPGQSWLIKEGYVETFEQLEVVFCHNYPHATLREYAPLVMGLIDARYRTKEVIDFCRPQSHRRWEARPVMGSAQMQSGKPYHASSVDKMPRGIGQTIGGLEFWTLNVNLFKDELNRLQQGTASGEGRSKWWLHADPSEGYMRELDAEHKVEDRRTGKRVWKVKASGRPNHRLDCEVYQVAAAHMLQWWALDAKNPPPKPNASPAPPAPRVDTIDQGTPSRRGRRRGSFLDI